MTHGAQRSFSLGHVAPTGWQSPPGRTPSLIGTVAAVPESAGSARWRCAEFAESVGATSTIIEAVMVAVSEAITNVVQYAYPGRRTGMAHVTARLDQAGRLLVAVADDGVGMTPSVPSGDARHGLEIIDKLTSELNVVSSPDQGTTIEMTFHLDAGRA